MGYQKNRIFSNPYSCFLLLFFFACVVKWFYLNQQGYYINFCDDMPGAYYDAKEFTIMQLIKKYFTFGLVASSRPFVGSFLYVLSFKLGGFQPVSLFLLGILIGSLLVPLYYLLISKLFNAETALFSSLILIFMTNYVMQSLALTAVIPGIIFLALSLIFATDHYKSYRLWKLYLSGFFLSMSVLCRIENALFVPFFILYNLVLDRQTKNYSKLIYWIIALSSSAYICLCSFKQSGDLLSFIYEQGKNAYRDTRYGMGLLKASLAVWTMLQKIIVWPIWALGIGGIFLMVIKHKKRSLFIISGLFVFIAPLLYKIARGTLCLNDIHFLTPSLFIIPVALEFLRTTSLILLKKKIYSYIFPGLTTLLLIFKFNNGNLIFDQNYRYPKELIKITEELKNIPPILPFYVDNVYFSYSFLFYLKRTPYQNIYAKGKLDWQIIEDKIFYILIPKDKISQSPWDKKLLVKDYNVFGLYKVTNLKGRY
jgi:hypothetical protein